MSYTFSDQQAKLSQLLGDSNSSTDDPWTLAMRKKELNRGELQFAKDAHDILEYATGTVAAGQIAVPSDWLETFALIIDNKIITNDRELSVKDWERFYNWNGTPPYYYFWEESGVRYIKLLGSTTGLTYKLYYFKRPVTELSDDADVSLHAEEWREAAPFYAASQLLQQAGKNQQADRYFQMYLKLVRDAQMQMEKRYLDKQYANVDINMATGAETDIQGGGFQ